MKREAIKKISQFDQITPEWLTALFKTQKMLVRGEVTSLHILQTKITNRCKIHIIKIILSPNSQSTRPLSKLVVKDYQPDFDFAQRLKPGIHKEIRFYQTLAQGMADIPIPACFYAHATEKPFDSLLIIENLEQNYADVAISSQKLTKSQIKLAIDTLGQIHAYWWDNPSLIKIAPQYEKNPNIRYRDFISVLSDKSAFFKYYKKAGNILWQWISHLDHQLSDTQMAMYKTVFQKYPRIFWERVKTQQNMTLIHGDAHLSQFFYNTNPTKDNQAAFLGDWEAWSITVGVFDLAYMMGMFWTSELRKKYREKGLIQYYHRKLIEYGVKHYSFDQCVEDYRFGLVNNFYIPLWNMNRSMFRKNAVKAFVDWKCEKIFDK